MNLSYGFVTSFIGEATKRLLPFTQIIHTDIIVQNVNMNTMNNEYVVINKTAIEKRIEEWEAGLQECYKAPVGKFNSDYVSTLQQAIATARDFLSQSTPLIPEIKKSYTKGFSEGIVFGMNTEYKYKTSEDYITNLKLDI